MRKMPDLSGSTNVADKITKTAGVAKTALLSRYSALLLLTMVALTMIAGPAEACGTRHFYNHSDWVVTVNLDSGKGSTCSGDFPNSPNVPICEIPPGGHADLHYSGWGGTIIITSDSGRISGQYSIDTFGACDLSHDGNTGNLVLNDPADGDVQTCGRRSGGNYDCK